MHKREARFVAASDQSLLVYLGDDISLNTHERVAKLVHLLAGRPREWMLNAHPSYASVLVRFDPLLTDHARAEQHIRACLEQIDEMELPEPRTVHIPVSYGGEFGPDLADVAALHGLTPEQVIDKHAAGTYIVYFLGFAPGFAYLGGLAPELETTRLATPRRQVPPGSVAIGGRQTGIYPFATPGGWRIIGRTPLVMFDPAREPMSLVALGDRVRFERIAPEALR